MKTYFSRIFLDHPRTVDESYFEHLLFAGRFAATLVVAGFCALVHALIPCLFQTTASRLILKLAARIENR